MPFDPTFPISGTTHWDDLYAGIRSNFQALWANFTVEDWITVTSFNDYWSVVTPVCYRKDPLGFVHMKGQLIASGTSSSMSTCFTLPSGYCPPYNSYYLNYYDAGRLSMYYFAIVTTGEITPWGTTNAGSIVYFDGIKFKT